MTWARSTDPMRWVNFWRKCGIALLWIGIWAALAAAVRQPLLLPSPARTVAALWALCTRPAFWVAIAASVLRIVTGFALGMAVGLLLGLLTGFSTWGRDFFAPLLSIIKATPVASFIMLALVWIRTDGVPIFATSLIVLPLAWANMDAGIGATDPDLIEMMRAFRTSAWTRLRTVYWPSVRPYLWAAVMSGMGMAWKAGVAAEVIAMPRESLGRYLYDAKIYLDTPGLFATTAVVIILSILLEKGVVLAAVGYRKIRRAAASGAYTRQ